VVVWQLGGADGIEPPAPPALGAPPPAEPLEPLALVLVVPGAPPAALVLVPSPPEPLTNDSPQPSSEPARISSEAAVRTASGGAHRFSVSRGYDSSPRRTM
jgi:hypothetical protein